MTRDEADDIKRHFDVVAERLEGQIRQVAEGVVLNGERLDKVDQRLDTLEQHFDRFETEVRSEFAQVRSARTASSMRCELSLGRSSP